MEAKHQKLTLYVEYVDIGNKLKLAHGFNVLTPLKVSD